MFYICHVDCFDSQTLGVWPDNTSRSALVELMSRYFLQTLSSNFLHIITVGSLVKNIKLVSFNSVTVLKNTLKCQQIIQDTKRSFSMCCAIDRIVPGIMLRILQASYAENQYFLMTKNTNVCNNERLPWQKDVYILKYIL